jgi:hypothetical protein
MVIGIGSGSGSAGRTSVSRDSTEGLDGPKSEVLRVVGPIQALIAMFAVAFLIPFLLG